MTVQRFTIRDVQRAFTSKLKAEPDVSGDHIYFYLSFKGSEYTVGKLSRSWRGTLNDTQIMMLTRRLHLKKREFENWVICNITNSEMIKLWQNRRQSL